MDKSSNGLLIALLSLFIIAVLALSGFSLYQTLNNRSQITDLKDEISKLSTAVDNLSKDAKEDSSTDDSTTTDPTPTTPTPTVKTYTKTLMSDMMENGEVKDAGLVVTLKTAEKITVGQDPKYGPSVRFTGTGYTVDIFAILAGASEVNGVGYHTGYSGTQYNPVTLKTNISLNRSGDVLSLWEAIMQGGKLSATSYAGLIYRFNVASTNAPGETSKSYKYVYRYFDAYLAKPVLCTVDERENNQSAKYDHCANDYLDLNLGTNRNGYVRVNCGVNDKANLTKCDAIMKNITFSLVK